jgi:alpha-mannosidase
MKKPLFTSGLGDFVSVKVNAFAPRWTLSDIWNAGDATKRETLRKEKLEEVSAKSGGPATVEETPHSIRYTQPLEHPRLAWATRRLEVWKREPRARLTFRLNRLSSFAPEIFYLATPLPCDDTLPRLSSGGQPFTPFTDQLPGSCRDYFAIDGWADYSMSDGRWLWISRDAPLLTFDGPQPLARRDRPPRRSGRLLAMIYNNFWYTNFLGDEPGVMEFQFDLVWRGDNSGDAAALAEALMSEPVVVINPALPEQPSFLKHLYQP